MRGPQRLGLGLELRSGGRGRPSKADPQLIQSYRLDTPEPLVPRGRRITVADGGMSCQDLNAESAGRGRGSRPGISAPAARLPGCPPPAAARFRAECRGGGSAGGVGGPTARRDRLQARPGGGPLPPATAAWNAKPQRGRVLPALPGPPGRGRAAGGGRWAVEDLARGQVRPASSGPARPRSSTARPRRETPKHAKTKLRWFPSRAWCARGAAPTMRGGLGRKSSGGEGGEGGAGLTAELVLLLAPSSAAKENSQPVWGTPPLPQPQDGSGQQ